MERRPFSEVLKNAKIDLMQEYNKLFTIFNEKDRDGVSYRNICEKAFVHYHFRGTCISLDEFDKRNEFIFRSTDCYWDIDVNYLVNYCEYVYNLIQCSRYVIHYWSNSAFPDPLEQIRNLIEKLGYMEAKDGALTIFVPKSQPAITVSEMLPPELSYKVIEYNHHSMRGDLKRKQATLKLLADRLEAERERLRSVNEALQDDLFFLLDCLNIRNHNTDADSAAYIQALAEMNKEKLEAWYDKTYDTCLYAFMSLEQADRTAEIRALKQQIAAMQA